MNGEIAQVYNIVLATKSALKKEMVSNIDLHIMKKKLNLYFWIIKNIKLKMLKNGLNIVLIEVYKILNF
ncbi:hypothetical protein LDK30_05510 [Fusobacterium polymorphum]|uniref:Uncharacterized protein n=1 Tax=Fusobacterium nucleatum subsp. polymorphum TaxID=76857 RepID=A0A2C6CBI3_FUSNP|nr:hypothetical protein [Fusobacterium polymorphum]PHI13754.1 hypothetical protein CBG59_08720 [Fusobacterium polymorphum]